MAMTRQHRHDNPVIQERARESRQPLTPPEAKLWYRIRGRQVAGCKFRRQHPIGSYIADFCCPEIRLVVELDGDSHGEQMEYDARRTMWLEAQGYEVLRFTNVYVVNHLDEAVGVIYRACEDRIGLSPSP
jgi:very-short-patch-repair endonuclease